MTPTDLPVEELAPRTEDEVREHLAAGKLVEAREVAAGAERSARAGDHDASHGTIGGGVVKRAGERVTQLGVDGVAAIGPVEDEREHAALPVRQQRGLHSA